MASPSTTSSPVAQWRAARRLYPVYSALAAQFALDAAPYENLDEEAVQAEPDFIARVQDWFDAVDARLQVAQFRQALQGSAAASSEEKLHALIERHFHKTQKTDADRDKLDFLLVQYFAVCAPPTLSDTDLRLEDAAEVLTPVLGSFALDTPEWLRPLDGWVASLPKLASLTDLHGSQLVQQSRQLKTSARQLYFAPVSLVAFTRFSFLLRRTFFRLINTELKSIDGGLEKLAEYGRNILDCTAAQMPAETSIADLRRFCTTYKKPTLPEYSVDTSILRLIQLRQIVDGALAEIELPNDPVLAEIEERCRRVEAELIAMRKLAAGLAAERRRTTPGKAAAPPAFEEVLDVPFEPEVPHPSQVHPPADVRPEIRVEAAPVVPEIKVEIVPEHAVSEGPDPSLTDAMEDIRKKLVGAPRKGISSLNIAGNALLLSADEVEAFIRPKDTSSIDLQRSLAARALLLQAVEMQKKTNSPELLSKTIQLCRTEAASIQQHSAEAKHAQNTSTATVLNASASQLLSLLRQVERISNAS